MSSVDTISWKENVKQHHCTCSDHSEEEINVTSIKAAITNAIATGSAGAGAGGGDGLSVLPLILIIAEYAAPFVSVVTTPPNREFTLWVSDMCWYASPGGKERWVLTGSSFDRKVIRHDMNDSG